MTLFKHGEFISHSGLKLSDKIECDALTEEDWKAVAIWFANRLDFHAVIGIPFGGIELAKALKPYANPKSNIVLLVDDVLTTGKSFENCRKGIHGDIMGAVLFARTAEFPPVDITSFY